MADKILNNPETLEWSKKLYSTYKKLRNIEKTEDCFQISRSVKELVKFYLQNHLFPFLKNRDNSFDLKQPLQT